MPKAKTSPKSKTPPPPEEPQAPAPKPTNAEPPKPTVVKAQTKRAVPIWLWVVVGVVVLAGAATAGWVMMGKGTPGSSTTGSDNQNTNTVTLVPRVLDGVPVAAADANPTVIAAMIENIKASRPPSGLDKAHVVYEALAEGGITRFLALFLAGEDIKEIGPIRSARPYYISWAEAYKPLYLHAGGSPQALSYLRSSKTNVIDYNQFYHGPNFIRDRSRAAPHNLYTNSFLMSDALNKLKLSTPTYTSWLFKDETPIDQRPETVNDIVIEFSSASYQVKYTYDRANNRYVRYVGGQPHVTRDGSQIYTDNIVVEYMKTGLIPGEKQRLQMSTVGTGDMIMFRDGTAVKGTWKKEKNTAHESFYDEQGNALALNPGTTWIEALPIGRKVTY